MRIECPKCKASGTINEHELPDEGSYLACPRCKESFHVARPRKKKTSAFATNTCPSCGYSTFCEEVFDECPHCGIEVQLFVEKKRGEDARKREQEPLNRNYTPEIVLPVLQPLPGQQNKTSTAVSERPKISFAGFADGFEPVAAVGWGVAVSAAILLVLGGVGLLHYFGTDIQAQLTEQSIEPVTAWHVFWGYGFLPWLETILGAAFMAASLGFLQRLSWGLQGMQRAVMVLMFLVPGYQGTQYIIWIMKSIDPPWWAYLVEFVSTVLVSALFVVPIFFLLRYLNSHNFNKTYLKH